MPLVLKRLPATGSSRLLDHERAAQQEIRPLRIQIADQEADGELLASWLAILSNTPLQLEIFLGVTAGSAAPIDAVIAWNETLPVLSGGVPALLAGEAARSWLADTHGIAAEHLTQPVAEVLPQRLVGDHEALLVAQEPVVDVPVARSWRFGIDAVSRHPGLVVLGFSPRSGVYLVYEAATRRLAVLSQIGWSPLAFARQARRLTAIDAQADEALPAWTWRSHVHLLVAAWLDLAVYQPASFSGKPETLPPRSEIPSRTARSELPTS